MKEFVLSQANIISIIIWLLAIGFVLRRYKKIKASAGVFIFAAVVFYLFSTAWFPRFLACRMETTYPPLTTLPVSMSKSDKVFIHLLGSGYQTDRRLPATAKLCLVAQGRFVEAMRLYKTIPNSVLVCSGSGPEGMETQAMIAKAAAIAMGADSTRLLTLDTPTTTREEAQALANAVGTGVAVILVTDALHMPRAMRFFKATGFSPVPSPTNFRALNGSNGVPHKWWPSEENIHLTDRLLHEYVASLKATLGL